jgi:hypothetical protein
MSDPGVDVERCRDDITELVSESSVSGWVGCAQNSLTCRNGSHI